MYRQATREEEQEQERERAARSREVVVRQSTSPVAVTSGTPLRLPRKRIYTTFAGAWVMGVVLGIMASILVLRTSTIPAPYPLYMLLFALPAIVAFLLGWMAHRTRLAILLGDIFGATLSLTFLLVHAASGYAPPWETFLLTLLFCTGVGALLSAIGSFARKRFAR
jgi:hypothetical protein